MSNKVIYWLVVILLILVGGVWFRSQLRENDADAAYYRKLVPPWKAEAIEEVQVATSGATLALMKRNEVWEVDGFAVETEKVLGLINRLLSPEEIEVVSESTTQDDVLGLGTDEIVTLLLTAQGEELKVQLGGTTRGGGYVRIGDDHTVFLLQEIPSRGELVDITYWQDLVLARIPQAQIESLVTNHEGVVVTLRQREGEWYEEDRDAPLDMTGLTSMLQTLENFRADAFRDESMTNKTPYLTVTVRLQGDQEAVLSFYFKDDEHVWVTNSMKKGVFEVPITVADNFELTSEDVVVKSQGVE